MLYEEHAISPEAAPARCRVTDERINQRWRYKVLARNRPDAVIVFFIFCRIQNTHLPWAAFFMQRWAKTLFLINAAGDFP